MLERNRSWLGDTADVEQASFLMGQTPICLLDYALQPDEQKARHLAALIGGNDDHPARELLWSSPGTMLAALFMHQRTAHAAFVPGDVVQPLVA